MTQGPPPYARPAQQRPAHTGTPTAQQRALTAEDLAGNLTDPNAIRERLQRASEHFNLIGSATIASLPLGCEVAINAVRIDKSEAYDVGFSKNGLSRVAVDKIANAAGVQVVRSTCLRSERRLCEYQVTVSMRRFDGTEVYSTASRTIDLREGSETLRVMRAKAKSKNKDVEQQVGEILFHLAGHAETKARLRATRPLLGLRTYTADELARPFIVPCLMFTGRVPGNPRMENMFAAAIATSFLGNRAAMFGQASQQPGVAMLLQGPSAPPLLSAASGPYGGPSTGNVGDLNYDAEDDGDGFEPPTAPAAPAPPPRAGDPARIFMPGKKGAPPIFVKDASDDDLAYWSGRLQKALADGTSQNVDRDTVTMLTIKAQINTRAGVLDPAQEPPLDPGAVDAGDFDRE